MRNFFRNLIVSFVLLLVVMVYSYMGGAGPASIYKSNTSGIEEPFYEYCLIVEELKYHVSDYVAVEGGDPIEFLEKFRTPVLLKNDISHAISRTIYDDKVNKIFGSGFNEFVKNSKIINDNYIFDVEYINNCVDSFRSGKYNVVLAQLSY